LSCLEEDGPSSASEIAEEIKVSPNKVKFILRDLIKSGYVRRASQDSE